jgi:hypothetical protein
MSVACHTPGTAIHTLSVHFSMSPILVNSFSKVVFTGRHLSFSAQETTCCVLLEFEQLIMCPGLKIFL